ncbi:MAG: glycosyltransferase family 2 protein [Alphaproteobacteria bacterium]|nr:glycosyltransferase family 2 protein [Alphaproteobacteria bacterium]
MNMTAGVPPILSIIVPVKDEEDAIPDFVRRVSAVIAALTDPAAQSYEILFIDDGSTDQSMAAIAAAHVANRNVRAISLSRNFGKEAALSAGLDHARGAAVVPMDVDLQDPPEVLADMIAKWRAGYDMVYGVRKDRTTDSLAKRWSADLYYKIHNMLSSDKIPDHAGDFRLLDRRVVDVLRALPERNRFMKGLFAWSGFKATSVEYVRAERMLGTTKFRPWKLWTLALDGITSSSTAPLRIWTYVGACVAALSFLYALFIITKVLIFGIAVAGYASLMVAVLFFGGLQLLSLGILGEYVGRIMMETKQRPLYIVRDSIGLSDDELTGTAGKK